MATGLTAQVEQYFAAVPQPHRATLLKVHAMIADLLPGAEQLITYGVPTFKVNGKGVAGVGFFKNHCTYFPMSGSITAELADRLTGFTTAKGSIRFSPETPLPETLVRELVAARQAEIARK